MAEGPSRKRPFLEEDDSQSKNLSQQKRVRFPKGKKLKVGDYVVDDQHEESPIQAQDPHLVAKERKRQRTQMTADLLDEENRGMLPDITKAEIQYEDDETFVDDGVELEPFNLTKERKEGYFDAAGNYVEYVNENEIKDAWLDGIDANKDYVPSTFVPPTIKDSAPDLSSDDIGKIKRRIADILEPQETVLQALRRLKGTSNNKKEKMSVETKQLFDQLTDDAMTLLENGDYNVYDEKKETFQREAEGYEKLSAARRQGISADSVDSGDDALDMFGEDDEKATVNPVSVRNDIDRIKSNEPAESGDLQYDYVYDDASGYYYSSRLGYYYDPSSGLYCCATSGQWFSYNEESGTYVEVQQDASNVS